MKKKKKKLKYKNIFKLFCIILVIFVGIKLLPKNHQEEEKKVDYNTYIGKKTCVEANRRK